MKKELLVKQGQGLGRLLNLWSTRPKVPSPAPYKSAMMAHTCGASTRGGSWRVTGSRLSLASGREKEIGGGTERVKEQSVSFDSVSTSQPTNPNWDTECPLPTNTISTPVISKIFVITSLFDVHGCFACIYVSVSHLFLVPVQARRECQICSLELQTILSPPVGVGNQTSVLWKKSLCSGPRGHLQTLQSFPRYSLSRKWVTLALCGAGMFWTAG